MLLFLESWFSIILKLHGKIWRETYTIGRFYIILYWCEPYIRSRYYVYLDQFKQRIVEDFYSLILLFLFIIILWYLIEIYTNISLKFLVNAKTSAHYFGEWIIIHCITKVIPSFWSRSNLLATHLLQILYIDPFLFTFKRFLP